MRVLAVDPGYGRCGVAVLEKKDGREELLFSDCIETASGDSFHDRLCVVSRSCAQLIAAYTPSCMALERVFMAKNQKTAMQIAEVRGALLHVAVSANIPVAEYTPRQIKQAAAGSGAADKKQVIKMLHALIKMKKPIVHDDEYDAIAIGITHLAHASSMMHRNFE